MIDAEEVKTDERRPAVFINRDRALIRPGLRPTGSLDLQKEMRTRWGYKPGTGCYWADYPEEELRPAESVFRTGLKWWALSDLAEIAVYSNAVESLPRIVEAGYGIVVLANQSELVAAGMEIEMAVEVHRAAMGLYRMAGIRIDGSYLCFHEAEQDDCECRLPKPAMFHQAAKDLSLNLGDSWFISADPLLLEAGLTAGLAPERLVQIADGGECARGEFGEVLLDMYYAVNRILGKE